MTELEYKILSAISLTGTTQWSAVVNIFAAEHSPVMLDAILHVMLDRKWICRTGGSSEPPLCYIRLDSDGILALQKESEVAADMRRQNAKQEKQQRFENNIAVANLLVPFITFILGILTERFGIIEALIELLK